MKVEQTALPGVLRIEPRLFRDARGVFFESWQAERYASAGLPERWVQDNVSRSRGGVLRGLHFQHPRGQGKLVMVVEGEVFDVVVDVRVGSPTFGRNTGLTLTASAGTALYIPPGFAHGFLVTSDEAVFLYKCTEYYSPDTERTLLWSDPALAIDWPRRDPLLAPKDAAGRLLRDFAPGELPQFTI